MNPTVESQTQLDDIANTVLNVLKEGKIGWIALIVLGLAGVRLYFWWKKQQRLLANEETKENREEARAETPKENAKIEDEWKNAEGNVDEARKKFHEEEGDSDQN